MLGGLLSSNIEKYKDSFLSEEVIEKIGFADVRFCNLESPLCRAANPPETNKTLLHAKEESVGLLKRAGFNVVSLANNHSMDFGWSSLGKTIDLLEKNNISHIGAGKNTKQAGMPVILEARGMSMAVLAYTWVYPMFKEASPAAGDRTPGVCPYDLYRIKQDVSRIKKDADFVVVSFHWGNEYTHFPDPRTVSEAHQIIDAGADLIIGSHPHVLQGIEQYKNGLIAYSLSNFLFPSWIGERRGRSLNYENKGEERRWYKESRESVILKCRFSRDKGLFDYELIPVLQDKKEPMVNIAGRDRGNRILKKIRKWSFYLPELDYQMQYIALRQKENSFSFLKKLLNEIGTYGFFGVLKRIKSKLVNKR